MTFMASQFSAKYSNTCIFPQMAFILSDTNPVLNKLNSRVEVKEKMLGQSLLLEMLCNDKSRHVMN